MPQWVVGQLSNIHQIKDPQVVKHALLHTISSLCDAVALLWPSVKSDLRYLYASNGKKSNLSWYNSTQ